MALMMRMQYTDLCMMSTVNRLYHRLGFRTTVDVCVVHLTAPHYPSLVDAALHVREAREESL